VSTFAEIFPLINFDAGELRGIVSSASGTDPGAGHSALSERVFPGLGVRWPTPDAFFDELELGASHLLCFYCISLYLSKEEKQRRITLVAHFSCSGTSGNDQFAHL
jgi:hypothetical protein